MNIIFIYFAVRFILGAEATGESCKLVDFTLNSPLSIDIDDR